ncbi:DNA-3-methyladenine glycosylase [Planctomycetota bacterium]|nr:DNA-3-methyladenine glycosylase [Planctomycetota bacterium]
MNLEIPEPLPRKFYDRDTVTVAKALLGQKLVRVDHGTGMVIAGIIVETEAYLGVIDKAAHTYNHHKTERVRTMWGEPGHAYVYFTYGMHHCVNVTTHGHGRPEAVLIRALEPTDGVEVMWDRREKAKKERDLCSGPAKLTKALGITLDLDGVDVTCPDSQLYVAGMRKRAYSGDLIASSERIGVGYAEEWAKKLFRFHLKQNLHVSKG